MEGEEHHQRSLGLGDDSSSDEYTPSLEDEDYEEDDKEIFTAEEIAAEREVDDDYEQVPEGLRQRYAPVKEESVDTSGGRTKRGAAVRAAVAIARETAARNATKSSGGGHHVPLVVAVIIVLAVIAPLYFYSLYNPVTASGSGRDACGVDTYEWAQMLNTELFKGSLQYPKADYAANGPVANIELISNLLYGKGTTQPAVMLFVSSDSPQRKQAMHKFIDGLAQIYYGTNSSTDLPMYKFDESEKADDMKRHIVDQLTACKGRGLFAVEARIMTDHFEFMETALEDGVSYIPLDGDKRVYTKGATFIVMDTLKEDLLKRFSHDPRRVDASVAHQMQLKHPRWTKRFGQRIQGIFLF